MKFKFKNSLILPAIAVTSFIPLISCNKPKNQELDKIIWMPSLYYGYSRTTQVHTPDEVESSSDGLGYYFSYIINDKNILIDDFFSAMAKMPLDFDTPLWGKLGIGISEINVEKNTFSFNFLFDNVLFEYMMPIAEGVNLGVRVNLNGYVVAKDVPFDITHDNKAFGPWQGHEWWLGLDIAKIFYYPDPDIHWSVSSRGRLEYEFDTPGIIKGKINLNGDFNYEAGKERMKELYDTIEEVLGTSYIPLEYMHNVVSKNDPEPTR